jgi:hypothetical protein
MSSSKAVFSFFDPAEINKSYSGKSATPKSSSNLSPKVSNSPSILSQASTSSSYKSSTSTSRDMRAASSTEISITYDNSQDEVSCNSQITERAANKSPTEVNTAAKYSGYNVNRSISNVSGGAMSQLSGSNASSSSANSHIEEEGEVIAHSLSSLGGVAEATNNGQVVSTREANYEEGASELFLLVEGAHWQEAITR